MASATRSRPSLAGRSRAVHLLGRLLALGLLLLAGACDKGGYGYTTSSPEHEVQMMNGGEFAQRADAGDVTAYSFDDDTLDGEVLSPEGASISARARSKHASTIGVRGSFAPGEAPDESSGERSPSPTSAAADKTETVDEPVSAAPEPRVAKRQVIYTATMNISVYRVDVALDVAEALPDQLGGWVQTRNDNIVILRIPAGELEGAMAQLGELGVVDAHTLEALDVTAKYTDLESRIRVLQQTQAQLQELLAQAENVEQALEIRRALDAVTLELELARARMRALAESIAFSTLVVRFTARTPAEALPSSNDPFPWVVGLGVESTEYR